MINKALLEEEFQDIRDVSFFNAAYVVIPPKRSQAAYHGFMNDYIAIYGEEVTSKVWPMIDEARKELAKVINCEPEEIGFTKNTAEAVGIIANGYPFKPGDNVIVTDLEHTSNINAWINQRRRGLDLKVVKSHEGAIDINDIFAAVDEHTVAIATSTVTFSSGFRIDLDKLGAFCHEKGLRLFLDGIQSCGRLLIDVKKQHIDSLAIGGNKGLLATLGVGFLYCKKDLIPSIIPPYAGYQSTMPSVDPRVTTDFTQIHWRDDARRFESGNLNYAGIATLKAGASIINELGIENIEEHIVMLDKRLREGIKDISLKVITPPEPIFHSGIVCIYYPIEHEKEVMDILHGRKIYTTMRSGYIRLGMHVYNTEADIDNAIAALKEIDKVAKVKN